MLKFSISLIISIYNKDISFVDSLNQFISEYDNYDVEFILIVNNCTNELNEFLNNSYSNIHKIKLIYKDTDDLQVIRNMGIFAVSNDYLLFINDFNKINEYDYFFTQNFDKTNVVCHNDFYLFKKSFIDELIMKDQEILLLNNYFFFYYIGLLLNFPINVVSKDSISIEDYFINLNILKNILVKNNIWNTKKEYIYNYFSDIIIEKAVYHDNNFKIDIIDYLVENFNFVFGDSHNIFNKIKDYGVNLNNKIFSIIIPCYNVEKYIEKSIKSIINQKHMDLDEIEIIIIDDGSSDNTSQLCKNFLNKYPKTIKYFYQENQGQAIAKNNALKYVSGDFVYFLDADDYLFEDTLINVKNFFKNNYSINLVAIPSFIFDEANDKIYDNYSVTDLSVIDLTKLWHYPLFSSSSVFFRRNVLEKYQFKDYKIFEDKLLINTILISDKKYGFINSGGICCCKRCDGFSITQKAMFDKFKYINSLLNYFDELIHDCLSKMYYVPKFIQYEISYESRWFLYSNGILYNLSFDEFEFLSNTLKDIFHHIDDDVINYCYNDNNSVKKALFNLKHDSYLLERENTLFKYIDDFMLLDSVKIHRIYIDIIKIKDNRLFISGFFKSFFNSEEINIILKKRANDVKYYSANISEYYNRKESSFLESYINFDFEVSLSDDENSEFKIYVAHEDIFNHLKVSFMNHARLSEISNYSVWGNYIILFKNDSFYLTNYSYLKMVSNEVSVLKRIFNKKGAYWTSALFFRLIYLLIYPFYRNKEIWLFMDKRETADDNAIHLFKYSINIHENIKKYFTISKDSKHFQELNELKNIVPFYSIKQRLIFLLSDKIISSHPDESVLNPFFNKNIKLYSGLINSEKIFLQHGVTKDNVSRWLRKYDKDLILLVTVSDIEAKSFLDHGYNYHEETIQVLGFPRFDNLKSESRKKQILIMPSWRRQLENLTDDEIKHSEYFIRFNSLLNDDKLIEYLKQKDYKIIFRPHPKVLEFIDLFDSNSQVILDTDSKYQDLFNNSSLLISDYSSVSFDFAYIKKPILYYHYSDDYHFKESYFDYENMGFGEVIHDHDDLVDIIINYIDNGCSMKEKYIRRVENFFKFIDKNNCKRVYESIKKL